MLFVHLQCAKTGTRNRPIKGPGLRIDLDVRRVWKCSKCDSTRKTEGIVVAQKCGCSEGGDWMQLVEEQKPLPAAAPVIEDEPASGIATEQEPAVEEVEHEKQLAAAEEVEVEKQMPEAETEQKPAVVEEQKQTAQIVQATDSPSQTDQPAKGPRRKKRRRNRKKGRKGRKQKPEGTPPQQQKPTQQQQSQRQ